MPRKRPTCPTPNRYVVAIFALLAVMAVSITLAILFPYQDSNAEKNAAGVEESQGGAVLVSVGGVPVVVEFDGKGEGSSSGDGVEDEVASVVFDSELVTDGDVDVDVDVSIDIAIDPTTTEEAVVDEEDEGVSSVSGQKVIPEPSASQPVEEMPAEAEDSYVTVTEENEKPVDVVEDDKFYLTPVGAGEEKPATSTSASVAVDNENENDPADNELEEQPAADATDELGEEPAEVVDELPSAEEAEAEVEPAVEIDVVAEQEVEIDIDSVEEPVDAGADADGAEPASTTTIDGDEVIIPAEEEVVVEGGETNADNEEAEETQAEGLADAVITTATTEETNVNDEVQSGEEPANDNTSTEEAIGSDSGTDSNSGNFGGVDFSTWEEDFGNSNNSNNNNPKEEATPTTTTEHQSLFDHNTGNDPQNINAESNSVGNQKEERGHRQRYLRVRA